MDVVGNVFSLILRDWLEKFYEGKIVEEQAISGRAEAVLIKGIAWDQVALKRLEVQKNTHLFC